MRKVCQVHAQRVPGPCTKRARSIRKGGPVHLQRGSGVAVLMAIQGAILIDLITWDSSGEAAPHYMA